jgi:tetratricopeptide (TPR) repeat protein
MTRWTTRRVKGVPRDVRRDPDTHKITGVAPWRAPLQPLSQPGCGHCGHPVEEGTACEGCGQTTDHVDSENQRILGKLGGSDLVQGAELAAEMGCHVLAVRLCRAAYLQGVEPLVARALRLQELVTIGDLELAASEAQAWVEEPDAPSFVGGVAAEVLVRCERFTEALAAVDQALELTPKDRQLRLDRAKILRKAGRGEEACREASMLMGRGDEVADRALKLVQDTAQDLLDSGDLDGCLQAIDHTRPVGHRNPQLCFLIAQAELQRDNVSTARKWCRHTLNLQPEHEPAQILLRDLEERLGVARTLR